MIQIDAQLKEQIEKELKLYISKQKTYMEYTSCMQKLSAWLSERLK